MKKIGEKSPQKIYGQLKIEFSGGQIVSKLQKTRKILKKNQKKNFENNWGKFFLGKPQKKSITKSKTNIHVKIPEKISTVFENHSKCRI